MPRRSKEIVNREMDKWGSMAIEGHFQGELPWMPMDRYLLKAMADIVGAASVEEVALMNSLTVNLHLLLLRFYKPTKERFKLLCEGRDLNSRPHGQDPTGRSLRQLGSPQ
mmetsp:Transcript_19319/g.16550  ORF Transcript_19319/g.16550 Transcript_19319/m.16550 type:complete len:110 (-) Transcript_19319:62-391(-)